MIARDEAQFDFLGYARLLGRARLFGYRFRRFDDFGQKTIYMRHDVCKSPPMARKMGRFEERLGVASNYFFLPSADTSNFLHPRVLDVMQELQDRGHLVGLHLDERVIGRDEEKISATIDWVQDVLVDVDPVVAFHRPTDDVLGERYEEFVSTYDSYWFSDDCYASDSGRNGSVVRKLNQLLYDEVDPIQVLIHPGWWSGLQSTRMLGEEIVSRRQSEVREYIMENFGTSIDIEPSETLSDV